MAETKPTLGAAPAQSAERRTALAFLLPNLTGFLLFTAGPVLAAVGLSLFSWDLLGAPQWRGLQNFATLLGFHATGEGWRPNDPEFWHYLGNTFFLLLNLPLNMAGSLLLAMALNRRLRGIWLYRLVFFMPSILAGVAIYYLWRWMYNPQFGLFNSLLALAGVEGPQWLLDEHWVKPALMLMQSWMTVGGTSMILYLAALQGVPSELYEAAEIDGAGWWARLRYVVWPSVRPVTFFVLTMGFIHGLQSGVDAVYVMTGGGPYGASTNLGFYIYRKAFVEFQMGYAAAISLVLFAIIFAVTAVNWRKGGRVELS
ncbi:MAG: sugar ABC transporter permease [Opitutaceae bacterium]|nr:sugar ABC transporter permease [Opitutaceae bacterium]